MSSQDIVELLADEEGSVNVFDALTAVENGVERLKSEGASLSGQDAINLLAAHVEYVHDLLVEQALLVQQRLDGITVILGRMAGQNVKDPGPMDLEAEAKMMRAGSRLDYVARMYDVLEYNLEQEEDTDVEA